MLLLAATMAALAWANSPWAGGDQYFWHTSLSIGPGSWAVAVPTGERAAV